MNRNSDSCLSERKCLEIRSSESRKVRKPMMEKKRRARINQSLNDLKRLLMETNSVKKEGSCSTKLEKADVLELTVNYVQKLHKQRSTLRDNLNGHCSSPPSSFSPSIASSKFKAGFSECARIVREILHNQPQKTVEGDLTKRVSQYLDTYLNNLISDSINQISPSPSLGSDSCTSFEEKDMDTSEFHIDTSTPSIRVCSTSSVSEESQDSCSRRSLSNEANSFDLTQTPKSSPRNALNIIPSHWNCGFKSVSLFGSPDLTIGNLNQGNQWENHQVVPSSIPWERKEKTSDANNTSNVELLACAFPSRSVFFSDSSSNSLNSPPNQHQYSPEVVYHHQISLYDDHIPLSSSISDANHLKVWRPW